MNKLKDSDLLSSGSLADLQVKKLRNGALACALVL